MPVRFINHDLGIIEHRIHQLRPVLPGEVSGLDDDADA
jgi:hypothetical protein